MVCIVEERLKSHYHVCCVSLQEHGKRERRQERDIGSAVFFGHLSSNIFPLSLMFTLTFYFDSVSRAQSK